MLEVKVRGLRSLLWSRWGHDWRAMRPAAKIASEVTRELDAGEVLLLHDADHYSEPGCWRGTAEALPMVLERMGSAALRLRPGRPPRRWARRARGRSAIRAPLSSRRPARTSPPARTQPPGRGWARRRAPAGAPRPARARARTRRDSGELPRAEE